MASAHPLPVPCANSSLQLFDVPVTDVSIVSSKWIDYEPVQMGANPIEFVIKPLADYIDINKTELRLVVKITKQDGSPTGDGKKYTLNDCEQGSSQRHIHIPSFTWIRKSIKPMNPFR